MYLFSVAVQCRVPGQRLILKCVENDINARHFLRAPVDGEGLVGGPVEGLVEGLVEGPVARHLVGYDDANKEDGVMSCPGRWMRVATLLPLLFVIGACTGIPEGIRPVTGFEQERYLGRWYEVARLDHSFERGLTDVIAEYSLGEDGSIRVVNSGTDAESGERQVAEGRAKFVGDPDVAHLKVSFFGPFYGSYIVFGLEEDYQHAFVSGFNTDYLWLLARTPDVSQAVKDEFVAQADKAGFDTDELVWFGSD